MKLLCALLTLVCCLAAETSAQSGLFSLTGAVLDQNDAVVAKARVVVRGADRQQRSTSTDASGAFRFERLAAGDYETKSPARDSNQLPSVSRLARASQIRCGYCYRSLNCNRRSP